MFTPLNSMMLKITKLTDGSLTPRLCGSDKEHKDTEKSEHLEAPQACQSYAATVAIPISGPITATLTGISLHTCTLIYTQTYLVSVISCVLFRLLRGWWS